MPKTFKIDLTDLTGSQFNAQGALYFIYFLRGHTTLSFNGEQFDMTLNDFILMQSLDDLSIINCKDTLAYVFEIGETDLLQMTDVMDLASVNSKKISTTTMKKISHSFLNLLNCYLDSKQNQMLIDSYLLQFLNALKSDIVEEAFEPSHVGKDDSKRIQLIKKMIHRNLHTRMSIEELADELYLTPQYLSRYIKEKLGVTYLHYISKLRLQFAEKDLIETNLSLTAIAHQRGFANVNTLIRSFKEKHEMTPKTFRLMHQKEFHDPIEPKSLISDDDLKQAKEQVKALMQKEAYLDEPLTYQAKVIEIDVKKGEVVEKSVSKTINLGFARNVLTNQFQEQLSKLQSDLSFTYARFQGIFEPGIIDRIPNTEFYNFSKANRIIDFLYANQLLPFIELGNKPEKINLSAEQYVSLSEHNRLYRNTSEWQQLVKGFIKNCINRYGTSEVSKWMFDYWYPHGKALEYSLSYAEMYIHNYKILYDTIKHYLPMAMVGGMSLNITANEISISSIVNLMFLKKVPFDFISIAAFHTEGHHHMATLTTNPAYLTDKINTLKKLTHLGKTPLFLVEWSFDVSTRNYLHDSLYMASFIMMNLIEQSDPYTDMAYWLMSDLMIEFSDTNQVLFGGNGLLSVDGLPKPSYFAYLFYRRLGKRVIQKGPGYIVTSNSMDSYQVLLYHYQHPSEMYCMKYQQDLGYQHLDQIFHEHKQIEVNLKLDHLVKGHYRIKKYHISEKTGSILNEWIQLGAVNHLSHSEIMYLKNITQPALRIDYTEETESIHLSEMVKSHELLFIQISLEYKEAL
jgi:xylan 1,4-beta-xylosidase